MDKDDKNKKIKKTIENETFNLEEEKDEEEMSEVEEEQEEPETEEMTKRELEKHVKTDDEF